MNARSLTTLAVAMAICTSALAGNIVIRNGSFEDNWLADGAWQHAAPDEWSIGGDDTDDVGYQNAPSNWMTPEAVDGQMSAFVDGMDGATPAWLAQELQYDDGSAVLAAEGLVVDLEFYLGRKNGLPTPPIVEVILECESEGVWQAFASYTYDTGAAGLGQGQWDYVHAPLTVTGLAGTGYEGQPVHLKFLNHATHGIDYYAQGSIDAVDIIPEPITLTLLGLGAAALVTRKRGSLAGR